jgi:glycosyltransferase involved in cell wall biosynthesis
MRILLITDNHARAGGAENYFFDLKTRLKNIDGLEVYSLGFGSTHTEGEDFIILKGVQSKFAKLIWQLFLHPRMYFTLRRHIKKIQPDIIHLHNIKQYTVSLLRAVQHLPVVQTVHDYSILCPSAQNLHRDLTPCPTGVRAACFWQHRLHHSLLTYLALTLAFLSRRKHVKKTVDTFLAPSPLLADYLRMNQLQRAVYIPPFKNQPKPAAFDAIQPYHFLFAGNLGVHKGIHILLEEFALAHQKNPQLTLTIAGTGREEKQLRARVSELHLEKNIRFIGWQKNLDEEYAKCAAVIFPSIGLETFGLVMTEAMSHARPVLGSNRGTPPWVVNDGETGLIFDPVKKGDLAEKILMLAGNMELITRLGKNGEEKLRVFIDNEKVLGEIVGVYDEETS